MVAGNNEQPNILLTRIAVSLERIAEAMNSNGKRANCTREERALLALAGQQKPTLTSVAKAAGVDRRTLKKLPKFMAALDLANGGQPRRVKFSDCTE
ncbi:MAG: hypothetical protein KDA90_08450 [Planctomycetaceae bacterium]|nr:hypothetical protein [Planctomycetaceae bacterium]